VLGLSVLAPHTAFAANANFFGPIISTQCECPISAPDWGCVLQTIQNVVNLGISLGVIFAVIVIAWGGFLWMTSSVNVRNREQAKTMLSHAVIGLVIALSAWLLVDFVMKILYNPDAEASGVKYGPWNTILADGEQNFCLEKREPPAAPATTGTSPTTGTTPTTGDPTATTPTTGGTTCSNCISVTIPHKSPPNGCDLNGGNDGVSAPNPAITECKMNSGLHGKVGAALNAVSGWWVTEMWPPTTNHQASCHANGTCVDVADTGSANPNTDQIIAMANALKGQNLYVVFEWSGLTTAQCQEIREATGNSSKVKLMKIGSNPHFSVYLTDTQQSGLCQ
jgi:hypothetical protein